MWVLFREDVLGWFVVLTAISQALLWVACGVLYRRTRRRPEGGGGPRDW